MTNHNHRTLIIGVLVGVTLIIGGGIAGTAAADTTNGNVTITTLDAGQANAQIIETPDQTIVYDTGSFADAGAPVINYLQAENITSLSMVISHRDSNHVGGAAEIINYIENSTSGSVNSVYVSGGSPTSIPSIPYAVFLTQVNTNNISKEIVKEGDTIPTTHSNLSISVLNPQESGTSPDALSVVLRIDYEDTEWILSGDLPKEYETKVINDTDPSTLNVDSLTVGNHGANTSTSAMWLQAVNPDIVVIPAANSSQSGSGPEPVPPLSQYGHPKPSALDRIATEIANETVLDRIATEIPNDTPETLYTGKHGTVVETSNGEELTVSTQFDRTTNATEIDDAQRQNNSVAPTNLSELVTLEVVSTNTETATPPPTLGDSESDGENSYASENVIVLVIVAAGIAIVFARRD